MEIKQARFVVSNTNIKKCPAPNMPEYAFIGRSNVGKSSLINMLVNSKSMAKTSGKPGKTRLINHFIVNESWYIVDLPGYGYAKVPLAEKQKWENFIRNYILKRENLYCLFVLIDIRHEPQKVDMDFMEWLGVNQIPFSIVFTKADKLKPEEQDKILKKYEDKLFEKWEELPTWFISSAEKAIGREEILGFIEEVNNN